MARAIVPWRLLLLVATAVFALRADQSDPTRLRTATPHNVTLVYVGAADCAPCRAWRRGAGSAFRNSPEFSEIIYREVESPSVLDLLKDEYWPYDLRDYRDRLPQGAGVPLWFVIADGKLVERQFGESQWNSAVLPMLKALLQ